jgi:hypothetical protein
MRDAEPMFGGVSGMNLDFLVLRQQAGEAAALRDRGMWEWPADLTACSGHNTLICSWFTYLPSTHIRLIPDGNRNSDL